MRRHALHVILLVLAATIVYSNTFSVPFQFDGKHSIYENPEVTGELALPPFFTTPRSVVYRSFALNWSIGGPDVSGYHAVNIAIHILSGIFLYLFVLGIFKTRSMAGQEGKSAQDADRTFTSSDIAFLSALIFLVHPLQTQAVTYIVQRLASMAGMFYLLTIASYVWYRLNDGKGVRIALYCIAIISSVLAMKSKETAATLPLMITVLELTFFTGRLRGRALQLAPFYLSALLIPISLINVQGAASNVIGDATTLTRVQTSASRIGYLLTSSVVVARYLRLLVFPAGQNLDYDIPLYDSITQPVVAVSLLFHMVLMAAGIWLILRGRTNRVADGKPLLWSGPGRLIGFGIIWFYLALSVEQGLIPIVDPMFEHRMYLPIAGLAVAVTCLTFIIVSRRRAAAAVLLCASLALCGAAYARNRVWQSEISLWEDVTMKSPQKGRAWSNLGNAYLSDGHLQQAEAALRKAASLDPGLPDARYNLALTLLRMNRNDEALLNYLAYIKTDPGDPVAHNEVGIIHAMAGRYGQAEEQFMLAISLDPNYSAPYINMGNLMKAEGRMKEAVSYYQKAYELDPGDTSIREKINEMSRTAAP